jgi:hypothetical protein
MENSSHRASLLLICVPLSIFQLDAGIKMILNERIAKENLSAILTKLRAQGFRALPANPAQ